MLAFFLTHHPACNGGHRDRLSPMNSTFPAPDIPFTPISDLLLSHARREASKPALYDLDAQRGISWGELDAEASRIANRLEEIGTRRGDRIALLAEGGLEMLVLWAGLWRLGAVVVPLHPEMSEDSLVRAVALVAPKLVLWSSDWPKPQLLERLKAPRIRIGRWSAEGDARDAFFAELAATSAEARARPAVEPGDIAAIFCTSGTTALPKIVVADHLAFWMTGLSEIDIMGLSAADRTLEYRSFSWNSAQVMSLMPWLQLGLTLHVARKFSRSRFFGWIKRHDITFSVTVPTVIRMLLNRPVAVSAADLPSLRHMTCSSAPLDERSWRDFEARYGIKLVVCYGTSEAGSVCGNRPDRRKIGTVGFPSKHQQFEIVDRGGNPCPPGVEGEVTCGGPQLCRGLIEADGSLARVAGGRYRTGDVAVMDEEGFVRITGRIKDLIIRGGVNIAPLEIDQVLLQHPAVYEAAALGVPDPIYGEEVVAYVVPRDGAAPAASDLLGHCRARLGAFKSPKRVYIVSEIPKSGRGKVMRDALRARWLRERGAAGGG